MSAIQTQRGHDGDTGAERRTTCETAGIVIYTTKIAMPTSTSIESPTSDISLELQSSPL